MLIQWLNPPRAGLDVVPCRAAVLSRVPKECPVLLCVVQHPPLLRRGLWLGGSEPPSPPCPPLISEVLEWRSSTGKEREGALGLPSCQANAIWAAHWCYWGPGAVPRIHMIMKPGAIQSAGLKLGLRAFDSPQQPVGLPTLGPASFPARPKPPV